jgi:hypothetical protein
MKNGFPLVILPILLSFATSVCRRLLGVTRLGFTALVQCPVKKEAMNFQALRSRESEMIAAPAGESRSRRVWINTSFD